MKQNAIVTEIAATTKRRKANYDLVKGHVLAAVKKNEGITLNGLNELIGDKSPEDTPNRMQFTNIYAGVRMLKKEKILFGTTSKKNEGLYLTEAAAMAAKPVKTERAATKKDKAFTLEKLNTEKGTWKVIDGHDTKSEGMEAYKTASSVPGSEFRLMDNTGETPKVIKTNQKAAEASKPEKEAPKTEAVTA